MVLSSQNKEVVSHKLLDYVADFFPVDQPVYTGETFPTIVTAASSNHFHEVLKLLVNIKTVWKKVYPHTLVYFYDIGLTESERNVVNGNCT